LTIAGQTEVDRYRLLAAVLPPNPEVLWAPKPVELVPGPLTVPAGPLVP
jgi:hypothetical protein